LAFRLDRYLMIDQVPVSPAEQRLRELVARMRRDCDADQARLAGEFYDAVRHQLRRSRLGRQIEGARFDDVLQETMIAIWDGLSHFRHEAQLTTWIHRIFRNKVVDLGRRSGRKFEVAFDPDEHTELPSGDADIPVALSQQQVKGFLRTCISRVGKKHPLRVEALHYAQTGYSMQEIAVLLELL